MSEDLAAIIQRADQARRDDRLVDAHQGFSEAVVLCRQTGTRRELLRALRGLGQVERDLNRVDAALILYEEAVAICREESDLLALAHTVRHLGDIHQAAGHPEMAEPCYREALAIYRNHARTDLLDLANAIRPLAILKDKAGALNEAVALWSEARDLYAAVNVEAGVAESSDRLARLTQ